MKKTMAAMRVFLGVVAAALWLPVSATTTDIYYHNDLAGTPLAATDASGTLLWRQGYRPYGERLDPKAPAEQQPWFTGRAHVEAAGLSYFGARWYDPQLGRFMGVDPQGFDEANVHSFNRYAYANNNPYRFVDPDGRSPLGLFAWEVAKATGVGFALGVAADAISQGAAFGTVDLGMAATSSAAMAGGGAGFIGGAFSGIGAARSVGGLARQVESAASRTFKPGPYAGESIPARSAARDFTGAERAKGNQILKDSGCHTCGSRDPGTKSGNAVLDHQPVSRLNADNAAQRLYPQCINCSREQGLAVIRAIREGQL